MKKLAYLLGIGLAVIAFASCKEKAKDTTIITTKPVEEKVDKVQKMNDNAQNRTIEWLGGKYTIKVVRKADASLAKVSPDESSIFYDNKISVKILRSDGTEFFSRSFVKSDFNSYIDSNTRKHGCLLGVVFVRAEGDNLLFAASVGSPDDDSDEYVPLVVKISRTGSVTISQDTLMDTGSDDASEEEDDEDGV